MTRDEFIAGYCERSKVTWAELEAYGTHCLPCDCGEPECMGWQMRFIRLDVSTQPPGEGAR